MPNESGTGNLPADALPEINDNVEIPVTPEAPKFSLDAITDDAVKAPEMNLAELEKPIRSDNKLPEETSNESAKDQKTLEKKDGDKDTPKDDKSGEDKSAESEEEDEQGEETPAKEPTEEELKLHGNTKRDYSGFNANQIKVLKRLDNGRFTAVSQEWRALQSAASKSIELAQQLEEQRKIAEGKGIPDSWYQHPEAYTLTPEFRQVSTQYSQYDQMERHYTDQIAAIQDGKPWVAVTGVDANGNLQFSQPQQATPQAFALVNQALMQATTYKSQLQGKVEQLASNFQTTHKQAEAQLNTEVQKFIDKVHPDIKPVEVDEKNALGSMHPMYQNHPVAKSFAKSVAMNFAQGRMIAKLLAEKEQSAKVAADTKLAGPRGNNKLPKAGPTDGGARNGKGMVFDLNKYLQED